MSFEFNHVRTLRCPHCNDEVTWTPAEADKPCPQCQITVTPKPFHLYINVYISEGMSTETKEIGSFPLLADAAAEGYRLQKVTPEFSDFFVSCGGQRVGLQCYHIRQVSCCQSTTVFAANEGGPKPCPVCEAELEPHPYLVKLKIDSSAYYGEVSGEFHQTLDAAIASGAREEKSDFHCWGYFVAYVGDLVW